MSYTHGCIIPLIGGVSIASERVFGRRPEWLLSYSPFTPNDSHLVEYYDRQVEYRLVDQDPTPPKKVDVVSTVCPCAGLSMLSTTAGPDNPLNEWMDTTARYVLSELQPKVFWGENAPAFAGERGRKIRERIRDIGRENGYTMTVYRTKSLLHGLPQIRERSFYFFWRDTGTPELGYYNRELTDVEEVLTQPPTNSMSELVNKRIPTEDPYYRLVLDKLHPGLDHRGFQQQLTRTVSVPGYVDDKLPWPEVGKYFRDIGNENEAKKCDYRQMKLDIGRGYMLRGVVVPKKYAGAFVGHHPGLMTHPVHDRFLTYRECLDMMGLPRDFILLNPKKSVNHICQNVPVGTATDMAAEVKNYLDGKLPMIDSDYTFQYNAKRSTVPVGARYATLNPFLYEENTVAAV